MDKKVFEKDGDFVALLEEKIDPEQAKGLVDILVGVGKLAGVEREEEFKKFLNGAVNELEEKKAIFVHNVDLVVEAFKNASA